MPNHTGVDVSASVEGNRRVFVGRCKCGWESAPCHNAVHATALVEDHQMTARLRSRRRAS